MNKTKIAELVKQKIQFAQEEKIGYEEFYVSGVKANSKHEFLFFIKPEITVRSDKINISSILDLMFEKMDKYNLQVRDARILSASYLRSCNIIAQHYGVINSLCTDAKKNISGQAAETFESVFGEKVSDVELMGGFEYLSHCPHYNPETLNDLWQKNQVVKLAPGTYCAKVQTDLDQVYLVNGFHPQQINHFTEIGRSIVAFTLEGNVDWSIARKNFIGDTNPAEARPGSLRNELYLHRHDLGMQNVTNSNNGFHLSAGPVEGLVELIRYNSNYPTGQIKHVDDFIFGRLLLENFTTEQTDLILANTRVSSSNKTVSIFDLTEEMNNYQAIHLLKECTL